MQRNRKAFSYFSTKTYVVGTQKNSLNETAKNSLLSSSFEHPKHMLKIMGKKYLQFCAKKLLFISTCGRCIFTEIIENSSSNFARGTDLIHFVPRARARVCVCVRARACVCSCSTATFLIYSHLSLLG